MARVGSNDFVQAFNHESSDVNLSVAGKKFRLPAGQSVMVPYDLVRIHFGDPRAGGHERELRVDGRKNVVASREREVVRLRSLYGLEARITEAIANKQTPPTLAEVAPKVSFSDQMGNPIKTVVEDPTGVPNVELPLDTSSPEGIQAQLDQLASRMKALQDQQLKQTGGRGKGPANTDEVPEDGPKA